MAVSPDHSEWNFNGREELEELLDQFDIKKDDLCLVGSISLSARGLREHDDLDICVHSTKRHQIDQNSFNGFVAFVEERYKNIEISDDELIENDTYHDVIDGFKVVRPEISFSYKKLRDLPKDERDVELLVQYSQSTDDWNWDLYRSDYNQRPNSLLSRGIQSLQTDGLIVTADKVLGLMMRKFPLIRQVFSSLPVFDVRTPYDTLRKKTRLLTPAQLLNRQYNGNQFTGFDIVAHWAVLQSYENEKSFNFDYTKLKTSIETLVNTDTDKIEPITLTQSHRVIESEQVARLIHDEHEHIEVAFSFSRNHSGNESWLEAKGFTQQEIDAIKRYKIGLLERTGVLFFVIFWPLTHEYHDEMENELAKRVTVVDSEDLQIEDIEGFVHDIYDAQTDTAPDWAINWKAELMSKYPNTVRILKVELPNPRLHAGISREMEMIKNDVRHTFMDEFPDKYYLSLLHATDSFEDNLKAKKVIESHR